MRRNKKKKSRPRPLGDTSIPNKLATDISSGNYKFYEPDELPPYLNPPDNPRGSYSNTCILAIATSWNPELDLSGHKPTGTVYCILTYREDYDPNQQQHFNKDSQFIFTDAQGNPYTLHLYDPKEHIIPVATGTGLAFLKQTFRLPDTKSGTIKELEERCTSIAPYPKNASQEDDSE